MVVLYHAGIRSMPGGFGVLTFLVMSGFLITHLLLRENERTGTVALGKFYARRSLRIFPAFYVYWIVVVVDMLLRHRNVWMRDVCAFFYVSNYYQGLHGYPYSLLGHTWSLSVEEQFYLLWPGLFLCLRQRLPQLRTLLLLLIPAIWLLRIYLNFHLNEAYIYTAFETRVDALLCGCLLSIASYTGYAKELLGRMREKRAIAGIFSLLLVSLISATYLGVSYRNIVGFAIDPPLVALLIAGLTCTSGWVWMDSPPVTYLSRISYSTYLYQEAVIPAWKHLHLPLMVSVPGALIAVWCIAMLSYEFVEKPFLRLKPHFEVIHVKPTKGEPNSGHT